MLDCVVGGLLACVFDCVRALLIAYVLAFMCVCMFCVRSFMYVCVLFGVSVCMCDCLLIMLFVCLFM